MPNSDIPLVIIEVMSGPLDGMIAKIKKQTIYIGRLEKFNVCLSCGYKFYDDKMRCPKCDSSHIRAEKNDVVLKLDRYTSRVHAKIIFEDGRFWLEDMGSTNGTLLVKGDFQEEVVGKKPLSDSDMFKIGHTYLRFKLGN